WMCGSRATVERPFTISQTTTSGPLQRPRRPRLARHNPELPPGTPTVKILDIRPAPPGADGRAVAHYDAQVSPDLRLCGLRLVRTPDGRFLTYAANNHGKPTATFSRELANDLSRAASAALSE